MIELDNKDLIFFCTNKKYNFWYYEYEILIYRLNNEKYSFIQKIKEDRKGYKVQDDYWGCEVSPKGFSLYNIEKLSGNRFMSFSNYGIKMYSLNDKNQYSLVLLDTHIERIKKIYEINENKYIFCTKTRYGESLGAPPYDYILIEKVDIRKIENEELNRKINEINDENKVFSFGYEENEKVDVKESQAIISSLKLTYSCKTIFEYSTYGGTHNFSNIVILKNKYFIIFVDNHLLIFNLLNDILIKRYKFLGGCYYSNIIKWKNANDNEFLLINNDNKTLIELNEKNEIINLKIIGYYYLSDASSLSINEENRFYMSKKDSILLY